MIEFLLGAAVGAAVGALVAWRIASSTTRAPSVPTAGPDRNGRNELERHVLESVGVAIFVFDEDGDIIYRNGAAGFTRLPRTARALVEGEISDQVEAMLASGADASSREIDLFGPPPSLFAMTASRTVENGQSFVVVAVDDITDRRRLSEIRRSFVANVSHELRTPVGAIAVLAETLSATDDPATIARLSDRLTNAAHRLGEMIEDLLELSEIETSGGDRQERIVIADVVATATANLAESAEAKGVRLETEVEPRHLAVHADRRQLRSALQNLMDNAIKYSEADGTVVVSARQAGDDVRIDITDHGIGIPAGDLDRIFERFYRVDTARRRETGGSGLGLSIVNHVVQNHGGTVSVASAEGEGSTFTLTLPSNGAGVSIPEDIGEMHGV